MTQGKVYGPSELNKFVGPLIDVILFIDLYYSEHVIVWMCFTAVIADWTLDFFETFF